jgi:hypothetical protein
MYWKTALLFMLGLGVVPSSGHADSMSGPIGGAGGGEYNTVCEPGDHVVGFDIRLKRTVMTSIAPVCGKKGGTYGRPWAGGPAGKIYVARCPGLGMVTALNVSIDKTPLVSGLGFTCWNPYTSTVSEEGWAPFDTSVSTRMVRCGSGEISNGIFGRAGSAIDALGISCTPWEGP